VSEISESTGKRSPVQWLTRMFDRRARRAGRRDFLLRRMPKGGVCAEVGVFQGDFSARILAIAQPAKLHLVDPWSPLPDEQRYQRPSDYHTTDEAARRLTDRFEAVRRRYRQEIQAGRVEIHRMLSFDALELFDDGSLDWVYIDANHLYDYVKRDLEGFLPKLKAGGYLTGDDYGRRGTWDHGVTRAVDELIASGRVQCIELKNHQFVLRKPVAEVT
jgi:hypothetical protein